MRLFDFFIVFDFCNLFLGDDDLEQRVLEPHCLDPALKVLLDTVLLSCVCVYDVPFFF